MLHTVHEHGERPLRALFQPVFPAGVGEFVFTLDSDPYSRGLPALSSLPGVVEIVVAMLGGYVK